MSKATIITNPLLSDVQQLLDDIKVFPFTNDIYFVGGTAIQMRLNHRISFDIDLATPDNTLNRANITELTDYLRSKGRHVKDNLSLVEIENAKNEGHDLRDYQQDFDVDGIKLTLFTVDGNNKEKTILTKDAQLQQMENIKVASIDALFKMKSLVLIHRHKSRDMFDLYYLIKNEKYTVENIFECINQYRPTSSTKIAVNHLISPDLPSTDEGLDTIGIEVDIKKVARFFQKKIKNMDSSLLTSNSIDSILSKQGRGDC